MQIPVGGRVMEESETFSVMCIDDNVLLLDALERRLKLEPGFTSFHRLEDFQQAGDAVDAVQPTIVLLDVDLPGGVDAMEILADIVTRTPSSRVIILTAYPGGSLLAHAMSAGAWGFISKGVTSDRLIDGIRRVVHGDAVIALED
jgi:DNA-binding NarL/FixJ family response regulator